MQTSPQRNITHLTHDAGEDLIDDLTCPIEWARSSGHDIKALGHFAPLKNMF